MTCGSNRVSWVDCTDMSGITQHRQIGVDRVIASECLGNVVIYALAPEWQEMWVRTLLLEGSSSVPISITLHDNSIRWSYNITTNVAQLEYYDSGWDGWLSKGVCYWMTTYGFNSQPSLKLHSPMTFKYLHYCDINVSDRALLHTIH